MLNQESIQFLDDLRANNNREWFTEHKKQYELFKKNYHQLVADFLTKIVPFDATLSQLEVKNCVFRINRDIRFSKDKSPYKAHLGIWMASAAKNAESAGYYLHIERGQCFVGGGMYSPQPEQLNKIRKEINFFYDDFQEIIQNQEFINTYGNLNRNENSTLKTAPKGFEKDHPGIEYLKLKSFTATQKFELEEVLSPDFTDRMIQKMLVLKPFNDFINRALLTE